MRKGFLFSLVSLIWAEIIFAEIFIDVSTSEEYKVASIDNTLNIEWQDILQIQESVKKDESVYLFCRSGNRSEKAKQLLLDAGYNKVVNIGGFKDAESFIDKFLSNKQN